MKQILAAALLVAFLAPLARGQELNVEERTLDNGMTVLIVERHNAPVVSFNVKFRVGSVDEEVGRTGLAHILEHMLFKGTPVLGTKDYAAEKPLLDEIERLYLEYRKQKWALPLSLRNDSERFAKVVGLVDKVAKATGEDRESALAEVRAAAAECPQEVDSLVELRTAFYGVQAKLEELVVPEEDWRILEKNGARGLNASTMSDSTQYFYSLPRNRIELWALIESGRLRHPVLRQFYKEKEAIKEERRLRMGSNPDGRMYESLLSTAFMAHSYRWPTIGWTSDIEEVSRTEVEDFFRLHYAPNRAVATIVGDVTPDEIMPIIERYFGDIPAQPEPRPVVTVEPVQEGERRTRLVLPGNPSSRILMGYHRPAIGHPDFYVLDVIAGLLQTGRTSRLTQNVFFQKRVGQASAGSMDSRYPGLFILSGQPLPGRSLAELEEAMEAELARLRKEPVPEQELQKIKNQNEAAFVRQLRDNAGLAETLGHYEVLYGWEYVKTYRERLAAVTADDILRVANKYFRPENRSVVYIEQEEGK